MFYQKRGRRISSQASISPVDQAPEVHFTTQVYRILRESAYEAIWKLIECFMEVISLNLKRRQLLICIAIPLAVGGVSAWLTRESMNSFAAFVKPPLSPPGWLFPVVWTLLFVLMGLASYLVLMSAQPQQTINRALRLYGIQLGVNFFWSIFFFNLSLYLFSFLWLILLWLLILATIVRFYQISKTAGYLMVPYLLWVTFAGYLNLGIYLLN